MSMKILNQDMSNSVYKMHTESVTVAMLSLVFKVGAMSRSWTELTYADVEEYSGRMIAISYKSKKLKHEIK